MPYFESATFDTGLKNCRKSPTSLTQRKVNAYHSRNNRFPQVSRCPHQLASGTAQGRSFEESLNAN